MFAKNLINLLDEKLGHFLSHIESKLQPRYQYLGNSQGLTRLHTGDRFIVDTQSIDISIPIPIIESGTWEPWIEAPMRQAVREGNTVLDCGANMGYYSVILARAVGSTGLLYAFEPNPRMFGILRKNLAINGLNNTRIHNVALNNEDPAAAQMWVDPEFAGGGYLSKDMSTDMTQRGFQKIDIRTTRLDDILPTDTRVDLMKVDVEGFEPDLLFGARRTIERSPDLTLIVELSPGGWEGQGHDPGSVFAYLEELGFSFKLATQDAQLKPMAPTELIEAASTLGYTTCFFASRLF
jgi:FkbM family methyltransferase